ncbi:hypothetical protein F4167_10990 [Candidatus Poribacteria bacterium]|nr:hypothetical protein [Candidatus Poribacteria bacterium]MYG07121.1 hypothetical protein [Candidatus Poribacteria bacterium]MYI05845.1 hypothetical protein [Gemmatimonadota bacterium]
MKKFHVTIYVALSVFGATALWYFGHHRLTQKALNAPPTVIYNATTPPVVKNIETAKAPAQPISHSDNTAHLAPPETQTETPGITEPKTDTATPTNAHTGESDPMATDQTVSPETADTADTGADLEAERADWEARDQALQESLENAEIEKLRMAGEMADHFNTLSIEEQRALFEMFEKIVYEDIPRLHPGEDTPEQLDNLWNTVLSNLILVGYTPPEGVTLK